MFKHALTHDVAYESVARRAPARAAPHDRLRHRGAVRRPPRRALRDARAPLRARRGLGARARTTTSARPRRRPSSYANRAVVEHCRAGARDRRPARRSACPTSGARARGAARRRALLPERVRRLGRRLRARRGARGRRRTSAASHLARAAYSHFWAHDYEPRATRSSRRARSRSPRARRRCARRRRSQLLRGFAARRSRASSTRRSGSSREARRSARDDGESRACRRRPARRRSVAEWRGDYRRALTQERARDRSSRASTRLPHAPGAWRSGSSARRSAASATTVARSAAARGARRRASASATARGRAAS